MRTMNRPVLLMLTLLLLLGAASKLSAQGTAFNYQGRLSDAGAAANGKYDLRFAVFNAVTNGTQAGISLTNFNVPVSNGLFTVTLDFGSGLFTGTNYWLDIAVRATNVTTVFTTLVPRQPILPVPYAIFANSASNLLGNVSATQLTGTVPSSQIAGTYGNAVNFSSSANTFAGTFSGTGSALSNLNASQLASGTVADARLTPNVALLDRTQTFTGANNFTNTGNRFTGSFFGNGNVGWDAFAGPTVQAEFNHGYLLTNSQPVTLTLPPTPAGSEGTNIGYIVRISGAGSGGWRLAQNTNQSVYGSFLTAISSDWQLGFTGSGISGMASSADGLKMVSVAGNGGTFTSVDSGKTWSTINNNTMTCAAASADGIRLVVGNNAGAGSSILLSTNAGTSWYSPVTSVANCQALTMSANGTRMVAVINGGRIYTSANSGTNWTLVSTSPVNNNKTWYSVTSSSDGSKCAAVVYGGQIYTSSDYGTNWALQAASTTANWASIAASFDGSVLVAAVFGGRIYRSTDYGVNWTALTNAPTANWYSTDCSSDGSRLVAVAYGGGIYLSANRGDTWFSQPLADKNWTAVTCSADCTKIAAGYATTVSSGGIYYGQIYFQATTTSTTAGPAGSISGSQGTAVELQYIGNGKFMPVSSSGVIWAN
jgi:hypothetical protein